ncbi:hypothetical protein ACFYYH_32790 [Streptomyces sp. NPDC002018]
MAPPCWFATGASVGFGPGQRTALSTGFGFDFDFDFAKSTR